MPTKKRNQTISVKGETLKSGVRVSTWRHSYYSWRVSYFTGEGSRRKRIQKGFETKQEAVKWAKEVEKGLIAHGRLDHEITKKERQAVIAFREIVAQLPAKVETPSLAQIVEDYQRLIDGRRYSILVSDLIDEYLGSLSAKKLSQKYVDTMRHRLLRFDGDFGGRLACEITTESVEDWLQRLGLADVSVNHFRAAL